MQRLLSLQGGFETRRLILDVCEIVIKWEQDRLAFLNGEDIHIESVDFKYIYIIMLIMINQIKGTVQQSNNDVTAMQASPDLHKKMDKQFIDNIIMFLFRIATSIEQVYFIFTIIQYLFFILISSM